MKMGIIGYGNMARWHRNTISRIDGLAIKGVYDINDRQNVRAQEEGLSVYPSQEALLSDPEITFVLVATSNEAHAPIAIDAMRHGKHVVCEKPITVSVSEFEKMLAASEETNRFLTVHMNRRFDADFNTVQKIVSDGTLGQVFRIESRVHGSRGISDSWRRVRERGGGVVLDWGVHLFDQILLLKEGVELTQLYAWLTHVTTSRVEDGFSVFLTFADGTQVLVEACTSNFVQLPRWYILGDNGGAVIRDWGVSGEMICAKGQTEDDVVAVITESGYTKTMAPRRDDTISKYPLPITRTNICDFYQNVMDVIAGKAQPIIRHEEILRVMKLMEAVGESARTGTAISHPLG